MSGLTGYILFSLLSVAVTAVDKGGVCVSLQPLKEWQANENHPYVSNIFCRTSLAAVTRSTATASQAVQALCNTQGSNDFFSSSAVDAFMASRFVDPTETLNGTIHEHPNSTDPNTPWMLADVVLTGSKEQKRADASRKLRGIAQVDLILCSDPKCTVVVDLVKVQQPRAANQPPHPWSMLTSGIQGTSFQMAVSTARGLGDNDLENRSDWLLPQYGKDEGANAYEVVWVASRPNDVVYNNTDCWGSYRYAHVLPFAAQARLASKDASPWSSMCTGHHKVRELVQPFEAPEAAPQIGEGCSTGMLMVGAEPKIFKSK